MAVAKGIAALAVALLLSGSAQAVGIFGLNGGDTITDIGLTMNPSLVYDGSSQTLTISVGADYITRKNSLGVEDTIQLEGELGMVLSAGLDSVLFAFPFAAFEGAYTNGGAEMILFSNFDDVNPLNWVPILSADLDAPGLDFSIFGDPASMTGAYSVDAAFGDLLFRTAMSQAGGIVVSVSEDLTGLIFDDPAPGGLASFSTGNVNVTLSPEPGAFVQGGAVPEPSTAALLGLGLSALAVAAVRRRSLAR